MQPDSPLVACLRPSPNLGPRRGGSHPDILLLHYTGMATCEQAIDWLAAPRSRVSCHYVVDEAGVVTQMVAEDMRAWHAGVGAWGGVSDINSRSIGIEVHNPGHNLGYPDFPKIQMQAVAALCRDVIARWAIPARRVLAHSDVAPTRKIDPGEKFGWAGLAAVGVGHWVEPSPVTGHIYEVGGETAPGESLAAEVQQRLARYGYAIETTGCMDARSSAVIAAFQRHFRPARVDGRVDVSTLETLRRLARD